MPGAGNGGNRLFAGPRALVAFGFGLTGALAGLRLAVMDLFDHASAKARAAAAPLAERMRPRSLEEFVGQEEVIGAGAALRGCIEKDELFSLLLWGPPGTGKTTLARVVAHHTGRHFESFSAVTSGVKEVREVIERAAARLKYHGQRTILFVDEIHRFNKAQQDAFLPHVENGTITLIGATTENPSFEVVSPLLSRCRVFVLRALREAEIGIIIDRALADEERGLGALRPVLDEEARALLLRYSGGDARNALNALEMAAAIAPLSGAARRIDGETMRRTLQQRALLYDKSGEEHYNLISALHKAVRGSDPQGAVYWLMRMLWGGEDPMYIARRVVRMAVEDIGLADPQALSLAVAAKEAVHFIGMPEADAALAQAVIYLAAAPKSNTVYLACSKARQAIDETGHLPVPLHLRNAPTRLMKELGYGAGYKYAHHYPEVYAPQEYLPEELRDQVFYRPGDFGFEKEIGKRLAYWRRLREQLEKEQGDAP